MRIPKDAAAMDPPDVLLIRVLNECQQSQASHRRCMKELVKCRREFPSEFGELWKRCMFPVFENMKKEVAVERLVKFAVSLVTYRDENGDECDGFVEDFVKFLLSVADASNKCVRYRSCQILSEVILTLAEDAEVGAKLWDEMTACMQYHMQDKVPGIRVFAARALSRLFSTEDNDLENDSTILQFRLCLSLDPNAEVRRAAVLSMPVSNITIADIVERTSDVSDAVRKAAYFILATKIPIQSLTIRQRTTLLHRGLVDRVPSVKIECTKMLKDGWLSRDSQMDVMTLLRFLDVETNEKVGELVMQELLKEDTTRLDTSRSLRDYFISEDAHIDQTKERVRFMEPEEALYWRMLCLYLHSEAQAKRLEAANTRGAKADVLEAEAAEKVEILEMILPSTVADFVVLVEAHYHAGPSHRFVSRQLLMLANLLDFTDTANRRAAATLLNNILHIWTIEEHVSDLMEMIGDGIYLGGEKEWSHAVVQLAQKVHASPGAFEEAMAKVLVDLGRPCREGGANVLEWLQCLAVTGLLLENLKSFRQLPGHLIDSQEMVDGLLMPAATHLLPEIQRAGIRCLSLYCQLEEKPCVRIVQQLEAALCNASATVRIMAVKALFDVVMCHGATLLDKVMGVDLETGPTPKPRAHDIGIPDVVLQHDQARQVPVLEALANVLHDPTDVDVQEEGDGERETAKSVAAQGFGKLLMQSKLFPELQSLQTTVLPELLRLYFDEDTKDMPRLRQCLSVFFHNYASIAAEHKKCIAEVFIPLMRVEWPGISGSTGNPHVLAARKKCATQLSRFMLELLKQPLFSRSLNDSKEEDGNVVDNEAVEAPDEGQENLAINLASEIIKVSSKKSAAVKSYKSALCKVLVSLEFHPSRQKEISCMRKLLDLVTDSMSGEKLILKELRVMASQLKKIHKASEDVLTVEQLHSLLDSLGLSMSATEHPNQEVPKTPAARTNKKKKQTARPATPDSDDDFETPKVTTARAARACKTEALKRMQSSKLTSKSRAIDFESESSESGSTSDSGVEETDQ